MTESGALFWLAKESPAAMAGLRALLDRARLKIRDTERYEDLYAAHPFAPFTPLGADESIVKVEIRGVPQRSHSLVFLSTVLVFAGVGVVAYSAGPELWPIFRDHLRTILVFLAGLIGTGVFALGYGLFQRSAQAVPPPDPATETPLAELERFALEQRTRLRHVFRFQMATAIGVSVILVVLLLWSLVMFTIGQLSYAFALGSSSVGGMVLTRWMWEPFAKANKARRLADEADVLALGLRTRLQTIRRIADPVVRQDMQWRSVVDFIEESRR